MSRAVVWIPRERLTLPARDEAQAAKAAGQLEQLARHVLDSAGEVDPVIVRSVVLACCPHITHAAGRMRLWSEYLAAVKQESDLLDGRIGWADVDPELNCLDRTSAAIDVAVEMSKQALGALTGRDS